MTEKPAPRQNSFTRGLDVLISISQNGQSTVADIADELSVPASTVYRYVRALRDYGLVEESDGTYISGWRLFDIASHHLIHARLVEYGTPHLRRLSSETSETSVLVVRAGAYAICLRQAQSPNPDGFVFRVNQLLPLNAGAGQRVLLAYAPRAVLDVVRSRSNRPTESTPADADLLGLLDDTRRRGYAISRGELQSGAVAMSVPVFADGEVVCSLTVAGPEERCGSERWLRRTLELLRNSAAQLGVAFGAD